MSELEELIFIICFFPALFLILVALYLVEMTGLTYQIGEPIARLISRITGLRQE